MQNVLPSATAVKMWSKGQGGFEGWSRGQDDKMYLQKVKVKTDWQSVMDFELNNLSGKFKNPMAHSTTD